MSSPARSPAPDERMQRIEAVTDTALGHLDVEDLLRELLQRVRELLDVDTAAILLIDSAEQLVATAAKGLEVEIRQGFRVPLGKGFAGRIAAEKRPLIIENVDQSSLLNPTLWEKGIRSLLGVPMLAAGTAIGVLHVGSLTRRRFTDDDVHLLQLVAERASSAAQSRRAEVDRAAAAALERSLLPARLPNVAGLEFAARYVAGEREGVGGDWYDVFDLPRDGIGLVIGDVTGRGLDAAVAMGRLRSALRAYALESDDPSVVLDKLDRKVEHFEQGLMATVLYAIIEPPYELLQLSVAGHPPPVLAQDDRSGTLLDVPSDPPLGVQFGGPRRTHLIDLPPGTLLCFYTDGLVERRGVPLDDSLERLRATVTFDDVEAVCSRVMGTFVDDEPVNDDITLLAVRHTNGT